MGPSPTYHPPEGEECETSVEHGLPLLAEPAVECYSRRPRPSPMSGSRFVGARAVGPGWVSKSPLVRPPSEATPVLSRPTYLPIYENDMSHGQYSKKYCFVTILCARPRAKAFICVRLMYYSTMH